MSDKKSNMNENYDITDQFLERLDDLRKKQEVLSWEINNLRHEILSLKTPEARQESVRKDKVNVEKSEKPVREASHLKVDIEKFIGENIINKIGIAITVIGVAIGVKYAIDHELISPLARIVAGYLFGGVLLMLAIQLKRKYKNFSAVLLSGAMAIIYFITYAANSFYDLIPQFPSFILMVVITFFTVTAAIKYNMQVIAHIGLVGAYAVPFLLGGSEKIAVLFGYTAIINIGILAISFKRYWKALSYSSFLFTWLIYLIWSVTKYSDAEYFWLAVTFLSIFFMTFFVMFLAYKLRQKEKFDVYDVVLLLANSFIFYGAGNSIFAGHSSGSGVSGLFAFSNSVIHFIVSFFVYRQKNADRNLFYFITGMGLVFLTISIAVLLNGNPVTILWSGEAVLLFWLGRTKQIRFYEVLSYALIFLVFISYLQDLASFPLSAGQNAVVFKPFFNARFLTSLFVVVVFGFINFLNNNPLYPSPYKEKTYLNNLISFTISAVFLMALYLSLQVEISFYWENLYEASASWAYKGQDAPVLLRDRTLLYFKNIWLINYSLLFMSVFSILNIKKFRSRSWGYLNICISIITILVFLISGLYLFSELREIYLEQSLPGYFKGGAINISIRYISYIFAGLMFASVRMYIDRDFLNPVPFNFKVAYDILLYTSLIWILSSELISWMDIMHSTQPYKLGLSILWGVYSLFLIGIGIWKKKKHLRVGAIALFSVTLLKLFLFDLSHIDTIAKTIIFITLGILLLTISFLYIKYRNTISGPYGN